MNLVNLCNQLHPNRVVEVSILILQAEITDTSKETIHKLLAATVNKSLVEENYINSSLLYCLGLTNMPPKGPLKRIGGSLPDVDMDFCKLRRDEVIARIEEKYGKDKVAHIGTFGSMKAKASIRDVARARGFSYDLGNTLARLTLEPIEGKPQPLKTCYDKVPELNNLRYGPATDEQEVLVWAERMENRIRSFGTHASGLVISRDKLSRTVPLYPGKDGCATTQFEMKTVEEVGLIKFDFLGLRALTTIQQCTSLIQSRYGIEIDPLLIPVDDQKVYKQLQEGDVAGVFQLEGSSGMRDLLIQIKPNKLEDLSLLVAIFRPGPLESEMLQHYLKVRAGEATARYAIPELEPILSETDGMLIYQEQILTICRELAGYTMGEADLMRRAVGKKSEKEMAAQEEKFKTGMVKNGIDIQDANKIFNDIKAFASYGFNKSVDKNTKVDILSGTGNKLEVVSKKIVDCKKGDIVFSYDQNGVPITSNVIALHDHGIVPMWEIEFENGIIENCTLDHKWLTEEGMQPLWRILNKDLEVIGRRQAKERSKLNDNENIPLWSETKNSKTQSKRTQKELRKVPKRKKENSSRDQIKIQQVFRYAKNRIRDSKNYICSTRHTTATSRTVKKMEREQSRVVSRDTSKSSPISKDVKNGKLDGATSTSLGFQKKCSDQVWTRQKAGGLCQLSKALDARNRWSMAFSTGSWSRETRKNTTERYDARSRNKDSSMDLNKTRHDELQVIRGMYENINFRTHFPIRKFTSGLNSEKRKILQIKYLGMKQAYDLEVEAVCNKNADMHNFCLSSGLYTSNSHSACYGFISYQMAYLKTHYPIEFMTACLITNTDDPDEIIKYISYCKSINIRVLGPSLNESEYDFSIAKDNKNIRFGLSAIKNLGKPIQEIIEERTSNGSFKNPLNFINRINLSKINKKKLESLILAGAFDEFNFNRNSLLAFVDQVIEHKQLMSAYESKKVTYDKKIMEYNERQLEIEKWESRTKEDQKIARASGEKKPGQKKKPICPELPVTPQVIKLKELPTETILRSEKELLGYFVSGHPMDSVTEPCNWSISAIKEVVQERKVLERTKIEIIAVPSVIKEIVTKKKKEKMAYMQLEDTTGTIDAVMYPSTYTLQRDLLDTSTPIRIQGQLEIKESDTGIVCSISIQKIHNLQSVLLSKNETISIRISTPKELIDLSKKLRSTDGNTKIQITLVSQGKEIKFPVVQSGISKIELLRAYGN